MCACASKAQLVIAGVQRTSQIRTNRPTHTISQENTTFIWPHPAQWDVWGLRGGIKSMRKREAGLMNQSWFFMWRLIINLVVFSHLSLTFAAIYLTLVNAKNSCAHMHKHTYSSPPTKFAVYTLSTSLSSGLWKENKNQMSADYVGGTIHNKKNRKTV